MMYATFENQMLCKASSDRVPYFNKFCFNENEGQLGKVDEILGQINDFVRARQMFTIKLDEGISAESLEPGSRVLIGENYLFPLTRFTDPPPPRARGGRGGPRGRGMSRGGFSRGAPRGNFSRGRSFIRGRP
jgi:H/ACA ribonucleoprotein complex subunit 1